MYEQIAQYLNLKYPQVMYHFDLSGVWTPSHKSRNLYGRLNRRAYPDLFLALPATMPVVAHGCFLELKREGTKLTKRDGTWASDHIAEQADMLERLAANNYIAQFACGFDEAVAMIESYLEGSR